MGRCLKCGQVYVPESGYGGGSDLVTGSGAQWLGSMTVGGRGYVAAAYILLSLLALIGLMIGAVPLVVDFPNHAARLFVECNTADPTLSRMYSVEYSLIPNLAIDVLNQPLCGLVDPMTFLRGTLALTMAGILLLVWRLHGLLNERPNGFLLIAPAMTFNIVTSMGYLNYLIGTLLFLFFAWVMLRFDVLKRHPRLAIALPNIFGSLVFFCHIFALALVGLFLLGLRYAFERDYPFSQRMLRTGALTGAAFVIPLSMVLLTDRSDGEVIFEAVGKLRAAMAPFLYTDGWLAGALLCTWTVIICFAILAKRIELAPAIRAPLFFLVAYAALLPRVFLDAVDIDSRTLVSTGYLAVAGLGIRIKEDGRFVSAGLLEFIVGVVASITIAIQIYIFVPTVRQLERATDELRSGLRLIERGSAVISVQDETRGSAIPKRFYWHLGSYITLDRTGFNPLEFTGKGMQPLQATSSYACVDVQVAVPLSRPAAARLLEPATADILKLSKNRRYRYAYRWDKHFDYVLYYHFGAADNPFPELLQPVWQGSYFTIFRTQRFKRRRAPCLTSAS